jgi:AbrB family looped-hinge helix DNA binding protein
MNVQRGRIVAGGRLQVPADIRRLLGLSDGDPVVMRVIDGELRVRPIRDALSRIQARLRDYVPADAALADELIADRRIEAGDD